MKWFGAIVLACLPIGTFWAAYRLTDIYFQVRLIPYPFETIGIAVGTGTALWTLAIVWPVIGYLVRRPTTDKENPA